MASGSRPSLSENEKNLIEATKAKNVDKVKLYLKEKDVKVDCLDEDGMSPLQHAAYCGSRELCELFVDCGADVNLNEHDYKYTALMFAGLSGKLHCVSFLLEHGASTTVTNSIGRTAAQMAAFISNHEVVSMINNFLPKEELDYFTQPHGLEKEAKLPCHLLAPLYKLLLITNIHPVKIALHLEQQPVLLQNVDKIKKVLEALCERLVKSSGDRNEVLVLKIHHVACVIKACGNCYEEKNSLSSLIKSWLRTESGFPVGLEKFLRQNIRDFSFHESILFQQLVRTLSPVKIGDEPSAYSILIATINGQRAAANSTDLCGTCSETKAAKRCSACKAVQYCDQDCQKLHWFTHKKDCQQLGDERTKELESLEKLNLKDEEEQTESTEEIGQTCNANVHVSSS